MSKISELQLKYHCSFSEAHRTVEAINHITQTKGELLEILETEDREELEMYLIEYFKSKPKVTIQ